MASKVVDELRQKNNTAWANITRQLQGMEPYLERSDAPGEWTTRQVLCHLLFEPGWDPVATLRGFSEARFPVIEIEPGNPHVTDDRRRLSLSQFVDALDNQRRAVFGYLETVSDGDVQLRKARIPLFKQFMGTDEIPMAQYVGALFDFHWNDHAGQLGKIRKAVGLPVT